MSGPDRLKAMLAQNVVTGIDFVFVHADQRHARRVLSQAAEHALDADRRSPQLSQRAHPRRTAPTSRSRSEPPPPTGADVLRLATAASGGFAPYRSASPMRGSTRSSTTSPSASRRLRRDVDCEPPPHLCPPEPPVDVAVDYMARDFWSFRAALLAFAGQRYPAWQDRLEADVGVMLTEAISALGDEFATRTTASPARTTLETATQRRSVRRLARLVDYTVHDGLGATGWLDVTAAAMACCRRARRCRRCRTGCRARRARSRRRCRKAAAAGRGGAVTFEIGRGFAERDRPAGPRGYAIAPVRNTLPPYLWDSSQACLPVGAR